MKYEIKVPQAGESVTEAMISEWFKENGEMVEKDEAILELETDKANMELNADVGGVLSIGIGTGEVVTVGQTLGHIDTEGVGSGTAQEASDTPEAESEPAAKTEPGAPAEPAPAVPGDQPLAPSVRRIVAEENLDPTAIAGSGKDGRILKEDALAAATRKPPPQPVSEPPKAKLVDIPVAPKAGDRSERVVPMSMMRRRIAQRLLEAQNNAAILTTFNEIDMSAVMALRTKYKDTFLKKYGIKLGFMSFFVKACVEALRHVPEINAVVDQNNIVYRDYQDIGVAVGSNRGLVVPVIRNCGDLNFAQVEQQIADFGKRARDGKISLEELSGGTFTISNGGIYGSLLSTPILNPPQSGILGMHKIEKRPIAVGDDVVVRPMMYVALSYDHRIVDGQGAVTFLVKIKECIEDPARILLEI